MEQPSSGGTDYARYLLIDDLLRLQRPLTPGAHDELLFIVVHQAYELWFKLVVHELAHARDELEAGRPHTALPPLERVIAVWRLLMDQLTVLETMGPEGFLKFRDPLAPASGFQSRQFREIEWLSGARERWVPSGDPPAGPSLWEAFCLAARAQGIELPEGEGESARESRVAALAGLYLDHEGNAGRAALHAVAERLVDHDEGVVRWRFGHVLMASREIGARPGTGGSRGVGYLQTTLEQRFYPELWAVRNVL